MDRLKKNRYAVKHCARSVVRPTPRGQIGESPTVKLGSKRHVGGRETPELICECNSIPFSHFISQCADVRREEANDAIAHSPAATDRGDPLPVIRGYTGRDSHRGSVVRPSSGSPDHDSLSHGGNR